jgi:aminopeptidase N
LKAEWLQSYQANRSDVFNLSPASMAQRFLKNLALSYLMYTKGTDSEQIAMEQYRTASNMTDQLAAFRMLVHHETAFAEEVIEDFYQQWKHDQLVLDKWFTVQAAVPGAGALTRVKALFEHAEFDLKNPNRVRSLLGAFCAMNPLNFHSVDGQGYRLLAEYVEKLDQLNPQIAARLTIPLTRWKRYGSQRQQLMCMELGHIRGIEGLSSDVYELVSKSLDQ